MKYRKCTYPTLRVCDSFEMREGDFLRGVTCPLIGRLENLRGGGPLLLAPQGSKWQRRLALLLGLLASLASLFQLLLQKPSNINSAGPGRTAAPAT
jgi:hypothetical protein